MNNIYYNPENFGLRTVASLEFTDACYEFDTRVVWSDDNGMLYTARDNGCSCPTPFEDYESIESLEQVDIKALEREIELRKYVSNENFDSEAREFLDRVYAVMN